MRYLACITRAMLDGHAIIGMTKCEGSDLIRDTHCVFCKYYKQFGKEEEKYENVVISETERAEWS